MKNDLLSQIWKSQKKEVALDESENIIKKARKQRNGQFITLTVLSITVIILVAYFIRYAVSTWNNFSLGLLLMISSLIFRIILEYATIYRKQSQLIVLDNRSFQKYLKRYSRTRLRINYIVTPLCFGTYVYGFTMLLPYFKNEFSTGFYQYILISGIVSLLVLLGIVIHSVLKEKNLLKQLNRS